MVRESRHPRIRALLRSGALAVATVTMLVGCAAGPADEGGTDASREPGQLDAITVGVFTPGYQGANLHWGEDSGLFARYGLTVEVADVASLSAVIPPVVSEEFTFAYTGPISLILARSQGLPVQAVSGVVLIPAEDGESPNAAFATTDSGITEWADVSGKKVAVFCLQCDPEFYVRNAIDSNGGDSSTTSFVQLAPAEALEALKTGVVDVAPLNSPFSAAAYNDPELAWIGNHIGEFGDAPSTIAIGNENWMNANPDITQRFQEAMTELTTFLNDNHDVIREWTVKYYPVTEEEAEKITYPYLFTSDISGELLSGYAEGAERYGWTPEAIDADGLLWTAP